MTTAAADSRAWRRRRWCSTIILLFIVQVGLVFGLGDRALTVPRKALIVSAVLLAPESPNELLALNNPTLFAWANRQGFSGTAWLKMPLVNYQLADRTEPPRWLPLPVGELGASLHRFVQTNLAPPVQIADKPESRFTPPEFPSPATSMSTRSSLRVEGELAARRPLSEFELPSCAHTNILTSSVVEMWVNADGHTLTANLLSSSGSKEADQRALDLAKTTQFNSLRGSKLDQLTKNVAPLSWGKLIFEWHTMPMPATNVPPANL